MPKAWEPQILKPTDRRWMDFIASHPQATIFHHPAWINLITESYGFTSFIFAVINQQGDIEAGIPLIEVKGILNKKSWISLPYTDHCAPLYKDMASLQFLTSSLVDTSEENTIKKMELRWAYPDHPKIKSYSEFVLTRLNLEPDQQQIAKHIKPKHFRQIKVAYQRGVRIEWGRDREHICTFYDLHLQTRRRLGVPVQPWSFFRRLGDSIIKSGYGFVLLAYKGQMCVAAAVFLHWNKTLIYKYSASNEESRYLLAMDPILWTAISWGCQENFFWMDMGRTDLDNQGLRNFKRRWGAEEYPLFYSVLPRSAPRFRQKKILRLTQSIIRKSPAWVCRFAGQLSYRFFRG